MTDDKEWLKEAKELTVSAFWVAIDGDCFDVMLDKAIVALRRAITELEAKEAELADAKEQIHELRIDYEDLVAKLAEARAEIGRLQRLVIWHQEAGGRQI